jgi:hypothetical protein
MRAKELAALWVALDQETGGALYALRYECETNGWTPHLWAQTPDEGAPNGLTRLIFLGTAVGKTMYWDTVVIRDTSDLALRIKVSETIHDAARAAERIREGLARLDVGLDPTPEDSQAREMN